MSATLLLEKKTAAEGEAKDRCVVKEVENTGLVCTCSSAHMASHNAMCPACSEIASHDK